jgi:protein TonB
MSSFFKDKDQRNGLVGTVVFHTVLFILFLFLGLSYYDPKPEAGVMINFGYAEDGFGEEAVVSQQTPSASSASSSAEESVLTQDWQDAPSIDASDENKTTPEEDKPKTDPQVIETPVEKPAEKPDPKPSGALQSILDKTKNSESGGEGITEGGGDQGQENGDPKSSNRIGDGGGGGSGDGNYVLGGRLALAKPKPNYPCSDEGRVVVKIYVDQSGKVVRAIAGERIPGGAASTTTSSCLYNQAKKAAMKTTWEADATANDQQSGYIVYNFKRT